MSSTPGRRQRAPMTRARWVLLIGAILLAIALVAGWFALANRPLDLSRTKQTIKVTRSTETTRVSLSGTLAPQQQAHVSFAVPGTVQSVGVRVGDAVVTGQSLAQLDERDLRNAVALAQANLTAARASRQAVREANAASSAQLAAVDAQVSSAQANLDDAQKRLSDASLTSPLTGVVAQVNVEVGDQVSGSGAASGGLAGLAGMSGLSGMPGMSGLSGLTGSSGSAGATGSGPNILVVVPDSWQLEATVGTADLPSLESGQPAVVTPTGTAMQVEAVVDTIGIVATSQGGGTATFPVTLTITQRGVPLFTGASADAVVTTGTYANVLTLPIEAVNTTGEKATVDRPTGGKTTVTTGRTFGGRVEILSGLQVGDEVLAPLGLVASAPPPLPQFGPHSSSASPTAGR